MGMTVTPREHWGSKLGFILAATGSAVGLGNIWKFPFMAGMSGGAAFVVVYLVFVAAIGVPVLLMELAIGRRTEKDPVGAYKAVDRTGRFWIAGALGVLAGFVILSFYSVVAGWCMAYVVKAATGVFAGFTNPEDAGAHFGAFIAAPGPSIGYHALFIALCVGVVMGGIKGGIEKAAKLLMPALLVILLLLVVRGLTLPGSGAGLEFLFRSDLSKIANDPAILLAALGHAFFTLSLGMGAMITYGSYLNPDDNLTNSAFAVAILDTLVALLAGVAIFTAVFAFGLDPASGPGLIFNVLPVVFTQMPAGALFGVLFFLLLAIAALTSGISLLEVVTAYFVDEWKMPRKRAALLFGIAIFVLGVPSALSNGGPLSGLSILGLSFFDAADALSFKILLPVGGFLLAVFTLFVWGVEPFVAEVRRGGGVMLSPNLTRFLLVLVILLVGITLIAGLLGRV
jgi:NSS family neurotransmitter:Na+ symporter